MNDRFKVRIYDKKRDVMITEDNCYEEDNYENDEWWGTVTSMTITAISSFLELYNKDNRFVVMQSTGLKDKNGKLIYEGDILFNDSVENGKFYAVVKWDNKLAKFYLDDGENYLELDGDGFDEVIGNIYENKELLGEKK